MMACPQPGVMEQEAGYLAALPEAKTFEIVGYRLSLMNEAGEELVTYMAEQP
jgi:heat shock protein HslJ